MRRLLLALCLLVPLGLSADAEPLHAPSSVSPDATGLLREALRAAERGDRGEAERLFERAAKTSGGWVAAFVAGRVFEAAAPGWQAKVAQFAQLALEGDAPNDFGYFWLAVLRDLSTPGEGTLGEGDLLYRVFALQAVSLAEAPSDLQRELHRLEFGVLGGRVSPYRLQAAFGWARELSAEPAEARYDVYEKECDSAVAWAGEFLGFDAYCWRLLVSAAQRGAPEAMALAARESFGKTPQQWPQVDERLAQRWLCEAAEANRHSSAVLLAELVLLQDRQPWVRMLKIGYLLGSANRAGFDVAHLLAIWRQRATPWQLAQLDRQFGPGQYELPISCAM